MVQSSRIMHLPARWRTPLRGVIVTSPRPSRTLRSGVGTGCLSQANDRLDQAFLGPVRSYPERLARKIRH